MFSLAQAHKAFDSDGQIANEQLPHRFALTVKAFMDLVEAVKNYPCAKKAWFEYLGGPIDVVTARAE